MVTVVGPAMSLDAKGTIKGTIEFRTSKGINIVSKKHKPGSRAPFVLGYHAYNARIFTSEAVRHWHLLTTAERKEWDDYIA